METPWDRAVPPPGIYANVVELIADLDLVADSLRRSGAGRLADGALADLLTSARTFGFHFAALEIRQHSERHESALAEILAATGQCPDYASLTEVERNALLTRILDDGRPLPVSLARLTPASRETLELAPWFMSFTRSSSTPGLPGHTGMVGVMPIETS